MLLIRNKKCESVDDDAAAADDDDADVDDADGDMIPMRWPFFTGDTKNKFHTNIKEHVYILNVYCRDDIKVVIVIPWVVRLYVEIIHEL